MMKIEMRNIQAFIGCLWNTGNKEWEGIVAKELNNHMEVELIKSDKIILLLRKSDFGELVQSSNENNPVLR